MAENVPPGSATKATATADDANRGLPYYEKLRRDLRDTLQKKRLLDKNIASNPLPTNSLEESIYRHESSYLEETSAAGNIIKGFDNYIKSSTVNPASTGGTGTISGSAAGGGPGAGRRKAAVNESDRVFSKSSVGYMRDSDSPNSATSTPNHTATPTGGFERNGAGSNTTSVKGIDKKKKKASVLEDEEKPTKRQKITYGRRDE